jgi:hypothetical protein
MASTGAEHKLAAKFGSFAATAAERCRAALRGIAAVYRFGSFRTEVPEVDGAMTFYDAKGCPAITQSTSIGPQALAKVAFTVAGGMVTRSVTLG